MNRVAPQQERLAHPAQPQVRYGGDADVPDRMSQSTASIDLSLALGELPLAEESSGSPSLRARHDGWTTARQAVFLDALGGGVSVAVAAKAAGMSRESAYRLRRNPRARHFAARWAAIDAMPRIGLDFALLYDERRDAPTAGRDPFNVRAARPRFDGWLVGRMNALQKRGLKD